MTTNAKPKTQILAKRVLVVDDNESLAKTFGWMLEALGFETMIVRDGFIALAQAASFLPDIVMLDIGLPGMNGYDLCQKMRADPAFAKCVFIAQTGWDQPEHLERSKKAGFDHHWVKPISLERLEKLLGSLKYKTAA